MARDYPRKLIRSHLRKEERKNLRKTFLYGLATLILLFGLFFWGLPALIKLAAFITDIRSSNQPIEQTDNVPPSPPRLDFLPEYTQKQSLSISGFAEEGSTVDVFLNGLASGTVVTTAEGTFVFNDINLTPETNEIYTIAEDKEGNKSQPSKRVVVNFDNTPPEFEIVSPQDGEVFNGNKEKRINISGKTEKNTSLTINDRLIILDQEGGFSTEIELSEGENLIKIIAADRAENQTEKEVKVTFNP